MDKKISLKTNSRDINYLISILLKKFQDTGKDVFQFNELKKDIDIGFVLIKMRQAIILFANN